MKEVTHPTWIKVKGGLFLLLGILSASLIYASHPSLQTGLLLILAVWAFCRFYYFAFYVLERYVDASFRYTGLLSLARYWIRGRQKLQLKERS